MFYFFMHFTFSAILIYITIAMICSTSALHFENFIIFGGVLEPKRTSVIELLLRK